MMKSYIAFDLETTGLNAEEHEIIEIGALKVRDGRVEERFTELIRPECPISPFITGITGISNPMVRQARRKESVIPEFLDFCRNDVLIGHNILFDYKFMKVSAKQQGLPFEKQGIDTLKIARKVLQELPSRSLESLCQYYEIENRDAHRAYSDALATAKLYQTLSHYFEETDPDLFQPGDLSFKCKKVLPATRKQIQFLSRLAEEKDCPVHWKTEELTKNEASRLIDRILSGQYDRLDS